MKHKVVDHKVMRVSSYPLPALTAPSQEAQGREFIKFSSSPPLAIYSPPIFRVIQGAFFPLISLSSEPRIV